MKQIFIRDIIIAVLVSIITAMLFNEPSLALCMPLTYLFCIMGIEEYAEKYVRRKRIRRTIKKLRNGKVLPPASKQD